MRRSGCKVGRYLTSLPLSLQGLYMLMTRIFSPCSSSTSTAVTSPDATATCVATAGPRQIEMRMMLRMGAGSSSGSEVGGGMMRRHDDGMTGRSRGGS